MPRPITPETLAKLRAAFASEKKLIAACIESKSTFITALLPFFFMQFLELADDLGEIRFSIARYLPGGHVIERCKDITHAIQEFHGVQAESLDNTLPGFCKKMASDVLTQALPQMQASYAPSNAVAHNVLREFATGLNQVKEGRDTNYGACLQILRTIEIDHLSFPNLNTIYLKLQPQMERMIGFFKPVIGVIFEPAPENQRWLWFCNSMEKLVLEMQKAAAAPDKEIWGDILNAGCNKAHQASNEMRALSFLLLQIGTAFTCQWFINRSLSRGLYAQNMMGFDINTILTEEAAQDAIKTLNTNRPLLEERAKKSKNSMLWFSFLTLPLLIYLLCGPEIFQSTILTFMLSTLSFSGREGIHRLQDYRRKSRWETHRSQLIEQLNIALAGLKLTVSPQYEDNPEACYVLLVVEKSPTLKLTRDEQRQVLMRVLRQYKIDNTRMGGRYKFAISGQTIITNAPEINTTLQNEIQRHQSLAVLEKQLEELNAYIPLLIQPIEDQNGLPSFKCSMMNVDENTIKSIFNNNTIKLVSNQIIMDGFMPGNDALLKAFLASLKQAATPLRDVTDSAGNAGSAPLRLRRVPRQVTEVAAEAPVPVPEQIINIRWPRGKIFNSLEARAENYLRAGAVVPVTSAFFPANRYFCVFEISPQEIDNIDIYNKFLEQALYPRIGRLQGDQGILFWNEARSFNKFTYDGDVLAGRERIDYIAAAKIKIKGAGGDARCYGWSEMAVTGETLIHFIEYDPETH